MILISHRGNLDGVNPAKENSPKQIYKVLMMGLHVEIDVWFIDGKWLLGHDAPTYEVDKRMLLDDKLWCHAKNVDAFVEMTKAGIHCFWHQDDSYTLTSKGYIWCHAVNGEQLEDGVIVILGKPKLKIYTNVGICTDYPTYFL